MSVRVRFAPSPTGHVHIGNIRVAIFNYLFARNMGGQFLLRIEDTDRERSTEDAVNTMLETLSWLGLDYDEEPMYQSTRSVKHLEAANLLLEKGFAYKEDKGNTGQGECIIFKRPEEDVVYKDEVKGDLTKAAGDLQDFVIVRSNGTPVFHLANVVDDIEMGVTHIIRGDDHVENTFKHMHLFRCLGAEPPKYAHLPMIVNKQGKPYSKRDGDAFVGDFRSAGFSSDALFNFLALLGWSPGDDLEKMDIDQMISLFSLSRVKSSPAQMDIVKLTHLNGQYIAEIPLDEFIGKAREALKEFEWASGVDEEYFAKVCSLMQSRTHLYSYTKDWKYFFSSDIEYDEKAVRKQLKKEGRKEGLICLRKEVESAEFSEEGFEKMLRKAELEADIAEGKLNQPTRVAVTGLIKGAGLYETAALLGQEKVMLRLDYAIENLCEV